MLVLSEEDLTRQAAYALTHQWQVYPDVLLTPDDFAGGKSPDAYMQLQTIGKQSNFNVRDMAARTGGSATYRLRLALPEGARAYTLVLPEIYSAYRMYLGGTELLSMGVPEGEGFSEKIARKSVSFSGGGMTELLIAVSNRSHFSDGMTYPPIFGLSDAVVRLETTRLVMGLVCMLFALLCVGLSLYLILAFQGKREVRLWLFFCASLCITLTFSYPLIFHYMEISPRLWYAIELFGIYGGYLFVVMLQNEICAAPVLLKKCPTGVLAAFLALTVVYGLLPCYWVWLVHLFGGLATAIKLCTVAYLLYCAVTASLKTMPRGYLLLFCTTAFGISVLYDRLYSAWEPILGGWPTEYGSAVMLVGLGATLWHDLSEGYRFKLVFTEEKRHLSRQLEIQKAHHLELTGKIEDTIRLRHDERHHLQTLDGIYESKKYEQLGKYLSDYVLTSIPKSRTVLCKNMLVDTILSYYEGLCEREGIVFSCAAELPPTLPISDVDLSILLGNLMENAFEGAREPADKPFISLQATWENQMLLLLLENSFSTPLSRKGQQFLSVKHEGIGIGTQSIRSVVESYGGDCVFEDKNGIFKVSILISLQKI